MLSPQVKRLIREMAKCGYHNSTHQSSLNSLRQLYRQRRETIRREFFIDQNAPRTLTVLTREMDALVERVASEYLQQEKFCVLGIGGYGRRELYPYSDLDLLFLYRSSEKRSAEQAVEGMLHDLWDLHLLLGHQVWSLEDLHSLNLDQLRFVLALLAARIVTGDRSIGRHFLSQIFPTFLKQQQAVLAERIVDITSERHGSYLDTIDQLEPDLKESPGGSRDFLVGKWLLSFQSDCAMVPHYEEHIDQAHQFLQKLRTATHFLANRNHNQLTHRLQEQLAPLLGFAKANSQFAVESLMGEYYLNARLLHMFYRKTLEAAENPSATESIRVSKGGSLQKTSDILKVFCRSLDKGQPLDDSTCGAILRCLPSVSRNLNFPSLRDGIKALFRPRKGLYKTLSSMYELGVLEILFPEFSSIRGRLIRDFYHKYTVDEHSLLAIKNIEDLSQTEDPSEFRFLSLLEETVQPELLTLSLLLHDLGKARQGKHVEQSTRMAAKALARFGFSKPELETILFLIHNHLAMSSVFLRRDLEQTHVIQEFAKQIKSVDRLCYLCLLTFADIKAVAPNTLTQWKKDLL